MTRTCRMPHAVLAYVGGLLAVATTACGTGVASERPPMVARATGADSTPPAVGADTMRVSIALADSTAGVGATTPSPMRVTVSGTLEPQSRALLRAQLPGAVHTLSVKVGERVTAGRVLAVLDVPAVHSTMAAADAQVMAQEVASRQVQRERARVAQLLAVGGVSGAEMDDWESRVQAAEAALQAARAQRATAAADVARLTVRAPFDGIVERRVATQGSIVQVGDELVSIIDPRTLELEAAVAMSQAQLVHPGARIALRIAGLADTSITGRVVRVAPALDPITRQLRITVHVPNLAGHIPAGAWAEGRLLSDSAATPARVVERGR